MGGNEPPHDARREGSDRFMERSNDRSDPCLANCNAQLESGRIVSLVTFVSRVRGRATPHVKSQQLPLRCPRNTVTRTVATVGWEGFPNVGKPTAASVKQLNWQTRVGIYYSLLLPRGSFTSSYDPESLPVDAPFRWLLEARRRCVPRISSVRQQ
ncbi:hypothetical protein J6590_007364 [Homalodisca vitripennis]|nr:hypothetical protein J6590_007364 [Homalodisca vitripennis]